MKFLSRIIDLPRSAYTVTARPNLNARIGQKLLDLGTESRPRRRRSLRQAGALALPSIRATLTKARARSAAATAALCTKWAVIGIVLGIIVSELTPSLFPLPA